MTILVPIAQMDYGPIMPGICAMTGFVIIPIAGFAWFLLIQKKPRSILRIVFTAITSLILLAWIAALIDLQFEPSIDDTGALSAIENLPEVKQYVDSNYSAWPAGKTAMVANGEKYWHKWVVEVGDHDKQGNLKIPWQLFRVDCVSGAIEVQANPATDQWISLAAWRKTRH